MKHGETKVNKTALYFDLQLNLHAKSGIMAVSGNIAKILHKWLFWQYFPFSFEKLLLACHPLNEQNVNIATYYVHKNR